MQLGQWIDDSLNSLPICNEPFFIKLWNEGKLNYDDVNAFIDNIDEANAKLVCSILEKGKSLLILLPDDSEHRKALCVATSVIKTSLARIENPLRDLSILCIGSSAGLRYMLNKTYLGNICFGSLFRSNVISGKYSDFNDENEVSNNLPKIICLYKPTDFKETIAKVKPNWIVLDSDASFSDDWMDEFIKYCQKKLIRLIAFSSYKYSSTISTFIENNCQVFAWPEKLNNSNKTNLVQLFNHEEFNEIIPLCYKGKDIGLNEEIIKKIKTILFELSKRTSSLISKDALKITWRILRDLERICIPINIYETESKHFWGVFSIDNSCKGLHKYISYLNDQKPFSTLLEDCLVLLEKLKENYANQDPPTWKFICDLIAKPPENKLRFIVFPLKSQKQLVSYCLLSKFGISETELLSDCRIILCSLGDFLNTSFIDKHLVTSESKLSSILIGLPSKYAYDGVNKLFQYTNTSVLIFPHQLNSLSKVIKELNAKEEGLIKLNIRCLDTISNNNFKFKVPKLKTFAVSEKVILANVAESTIEQIPLRKMDISFNSNEFLHKIFDDQSDAEIETHSDLSSTSEEHNAIVDSVFEVQYENRLYSHYDVNDKVNLLRGDKIDIVYIRAIRSGDNIFYILDKPRTDLYDLIISKIHNHPAFFVPLGLLSKWKEEIFIAYAIWIEKSGNDLQSFLDQLQTQKSKITTESTLKNWLSGFTMSPRDRDDIKRVGEVLNSDFLLKNYKAIYNAASLVGGIHRSLARKLNKWLNLGMSDQSLDNELLDKDIGLTFGDLRVAFAIYRVTGIKQVHKPVLKSDLGKIFKHQN